jgi:nicotinamide mononucleotide adenylyltransferase
MNQLSQYLVDGILNEGEDSLGGVALFGGGFKPPTKGHLEVVLQGLKENPEVKQVQILVGSSERNGVTQEESIKIWEIYKRFIPVSTQIIKVQSPFSYIKTYLQDHQDENVYIFIGARLGNEADDKDVAERSAYAKKYSDKAIPVEIITIGGVSGTKARQAALSGNSEEFITFFPEQLTDSEREEIIQMVSSVIKEVKLPINENASYSKEIDVKGKIDQLTQHMLDKGYNIEPLPTVEFVDGDSENARDFFGKTAYYNPNNNTIVLYTEGRHPKDIVRSFSHEMVHHIQNLENRLGDVSTTNTMEDDNIDKLEQEANLKGTMTFRNWTDSLNEEKKKEKDPFGLNQYARELAQGLEEAIVGDKIECDNCDWSWDIKDGGDDLYICHKCGHDNTPQLNEGRYDKSTNEFSNIVFDMFKSIHDRGDKKGEFEFSVGPDDEDIYSEEFEFDLAGVVEITDGEYEVDGGANAGFDTKGEEVTPLLSVKFKIPKNPDWQKVSFDIKDVVRHELEHLTQDGGNEKPGKYMKDDQLIRDLIDSDMLSKSQYFKLEKEVDAMLQGLYFKAKKSKRPFGDVIDDYLNIFLDQETISPQEKEDILNTWRSRRKALSLPIFEQENMEDKYKIYLDMDGVIVDFDKRFTDLAGMGPREYESSFGKEKFWDFIDSKEKGGGVGFWVGMPWMPGGPELYNRVAQHNHALLSSPSRSESSKLGKRLWKKKYTPNTDLILSLAANKKNYADGNSILIDDRESNIQQWREAGGIGILYKSADQVNKELDKLGL